MGIDAEGGSCGLLRSSTISQHRVVALQGTVSKGSAQVSACLSAALDVTAEHCNAKFKRQ